MSNVRRVYVEKKPAYQGAARELLQEIKSYLGIHAVEGVRILIRYDVEHVLDATFAAACTGVFAEPPVDVLYHEGFSHTNRERIFSVEYLPGQYDQRADSAEQCIRFIKEDEKPIIRTATTYVIEGEITDDEFLSIKQHCINPVDSREAAKEKPETLVLASPTPKNVRILNGFQELIEEKLKELYHSLELAMTFQDFCHIQNYFKEEEKRDPSMTEIHVLDTYWSDHCRHTTFSTELTNITFGKGDYNVPMEATYKQYLADHSAIFKGREDKFICLMDLALMAMRKLKKEGKLKDQEESDEINACSIVVPVEVDGKTEEWLVNFKNETHNHPTEIEPFGGAATCLGGAIRDPLSGRTYVYQAMRVTGAADPTVAVKDTLEGKLPQKKIVREAARGYSSYGNQIGLATGLVKEIYHPDYVAKRMEIGAVMGAAPRRAVRRLTSDPGDVIVLLGGRTGRDGIGGATGSSKVHTEESTKESGAEVQKGNPPTERKIQRLFRREEVSYLIKKCNDFGAGGVSVAIGELAEGLVIDLDKVPKKYEGLDGTEIAISESQERMAVVVDPKDVEQFQRYAKEENLETSVVATVTKEPRLVLNWRGNNIVNLSRAFLDTNGAHQETEVFVSVPKAQQTMFAKKKVEDVRIEWMNKLSDLNVCSQKGLVEMFDSSIGSGSFYMPFGGKKQLTETQSMVAKLPVLEGQCDTVTMMSYGFDPYLSSWSPYHGAIYAVVESISKIVAGGGDYKKIRFTFQEYFERMNQDPIRWGKPFAALLGAYDAQLAFGLPSIGGKDSMSGTFEDIDVPPTLVSFAVDIAKEGDVITPELKTPGNKLLLLSVEKNEYDIPKYDALKQAYDALHRDIQDGKIASAYVLDRHGIIPGISKMAFGNELGVAIEAEVKEEELFSPSYGDIVVELKADETASFRAKVIAEVLSEPIFTYKELVISGEEALNTWKKPLETVFPTQSSESSNETIETKLYDAPDIYICKNKVAKPKVFIPVMPGTNCEYDSWRAFKRAGAEVETKVFKNLSAKDIIESVAEFEAGIKDAKIIMFPGGFSAGDEPDGSAKFFATAFANAKLREAVEDLIGQRDGLVLGVCNGFQALVKLGLVPFGSIVGQEKEAPTLTTNTIGRHISKMVYTKVVSNKSPWLSGAKLGGVYINPASHGEGRFVASKEWINRLFENGQVATQYCDPEGNLSMNEEWNVNGSYRAIEGITSPDGRIFGKMAHSERRDKGVAVNIYGEQDIKIFESGVNYFK